MGTPDQLQIGAGGILSHWQGLSRRKQGGGKEHPDESAWGKSLSWEDRQPLESWPKALGRSQHPLVKCPAPQQVRDEASTGGCPELPPIKEALARGCGCPPVILCFPPSALARGHPSISLPAPAEPSPTEDAMSLEKLLSALYYLVIIFPLKPEISKA